MTNCHQIKTMIDETEQPQSLPFEATHHVNACASCRSFADERASLRGLLSGIPRVNAPINFDAQLKARMNTVKTKPAFSWLSPALYLRFGAVSAALLMAVFVAQYNGMFSPAKNIVATVAPSAPVVNQPPTLPGLVATGPGTDVKPSLTPVTITPQTRVVAVASTSRGNHRVQPVLANFEDESISDRVPGVIVRRSPGRDVEVPMLPVSVGLQQQLMNRSSRPPVQQVAVYQSF